MGENLGISKSMNMIVLVLSLGFLGLSQDCHDYYTQESCPSPCWWEDPQYCSSNGHPGCCQDPACRDSNHQTAALCTTVNGTDCTWSGSYCSSSSCGDFTHNVQGTCTTVNNETCTWDDDNKYCSSATCGDFAHKSQETCTTVNWYTCVWDFDDGICQSQSCGDYNHKTQTKCSGTVNGNVCAWNASQNQGQGRCSSLQCSNYSLGECDGKIVGDAFCEWSTESGYGRCESVYCWDADGQAECSAMPSELGCKWIDHGPECNWCSTSDLDCSELDGDEEECKEEGGPCGCVWSNGKCTNSAFQAVVPTMLIAILLVFLL